MAGGSADIGIRVFLDDAASQALGTINSGLARMVSTTQTASRAMGGLSGAMAGVGVAVGFAVALVAFGAAIKYSVDQASLFQQAMFSVAIATHVPMGVAMQYSNTLMNLAASSIYTSTQIAEGIVQMGRAGYGIQAIFGGMAQAGIALGIATRTTAVQGFTMLTQAMAAYKAPASEAMHFADLLQFAFEHQRGTVSELTSAMSQVTPIAAAVGVPFREIVAALDVIGPAMKSTATAGVALRYMLSGLYTPTDKAQTEMVALGLASVDAGGHFHSAFFDAQGRAVDFDKAVHILSDHLKGMSQEDKLAALKNLFSTKGGQGALDLLNNIDNLDGYLRQLQGNSDNAGGAMRRWNEVMHTLGGAVAGLKSSITDLAVVIGGQFLPVLTNIANQANGFVSHIRSMASANPGATASFLKLGAAMSGVGLVATIVIMVLAGVGTGILAFIGIVAGVAAGVVLLTVGIMLVVNWFRQLYASSALVRGVLGALGASFNEIGALIRSSLASALQFLRPQLQSMMQALAEAGAALRPLLPILGMLAAVIVGVVIGAIRGLVLALVLFVTGLAMVVIGVITMASGIIQVFMGLWTVIRGIFSLNGAMILQGLSMIGSGILRIFQGAFQVLQGIIIGTLGAIVGFIVGFVMGVISWFQHLSSVLVGHSIIPDMMNAIRNAIMNGLNAVIGFISGWVGRIISFFANLAAQVQARVQMAFLMARMYIMMALVLIQAYVGQFVAQVVSRFQQLGAQIQAAVSSAWNFVRNTVLSAVNTIVGYITNFAAQVRARFQMAWDAAKMIVMAAIVTIQAYVSSGMANVISRVQQAGSQIITTANNAWNGFKTAVSNGINGAVSTVQGGVARIIGVISGLPGQLYSWGARAMQSFANGLGSTLGAVVSKVQQAAASVANFLAHSSPAKMGPLSRDDQWMPNMMAMFASQIESHAPLLTNALTRATGSMALSPQMARIAGPTIAPTVAGGGGGGGGSKIVQLVVNGRILGQAVMDDFTTQLQLNGAGRAFR